MESKFFKIIVHDESSIPTLLGICASFENGEWRGQRLVENLFNCIPDFCLSYSEVHTDKLCLKDKISSLIFALLRKLNTVLSLSILTFLINPKSLNL